MVRLCDQDRRKRDLLACLRAKINPDASDHEVFGKLPLQFVGVNTVETLMKVKLEKRRVPDTMEPRTRVVTSNAEAANSRRKWLSGVFKFGVKQGLLPYDFTKDVPKAKNDKLTPEQADGWPTWSKGVDRCLSRGSPPWQSRTPRDGTCLQPDSA
jgi:hypothetical protein